MELLLLSLFAGGLTVLSPCVLPLLPVIMGGSISDKNWRGPITIIASLSISIFAFTMALRVSTAFLSVPDVFWQRFSGVIVVLVGIAMVFPAIWTYISVKTKFDEKSHDLQQKSTGKEGMSRNVILGVSLGPIFTSCSPTFGLIVTTVIPANLIEGIVYLLAYIAGLCLVLFFVAFGGQKAIGKLKWASAGDSKFRKILGIFLILVGVLIASGLIRELEIWWAGSDFNFINYEIGLLPDRN